MMSACFAASSATHRLEAVAHGQIVIRAAGPLADDHLAAAVAQILGLGVPLRTVAENGDRLALEQPKDRHRCRNRFLQACLGSKGSGVRISSRRISEALRQNFKPTSRGLRRLNAGGSFSAAAAAGSGRQMPRTMAIRPVRASSIMPNGRIISINASIFFSWPEISTITWSLATSTIRPRKISHSSRISPPLAAGGPHA